MKFHLKYSLDLLRGIINKHLECLHHTKATAVSTANWKLTPVSCFMHKQLGWPGLLSLSSSTDKTGAAVCSWGKLFTEGIQCKWADVHCSGTVADSGHIRRQWLGPYSGASYDKMHAAGLCGGHDAHLRQGRKPCLDGGPRQEPVKGPQLAHRRVVLHRLFTLCCRVQNGLSVTYLESNFYFQRYNLLSHLTDWPWVDI